MPRNVCSRPAAARSAFPSAAPSRATSIVSAIIVPFASSRRQPPTTRPSTATRWFATTSGRSLNICGIPGASEGRVIAVGDDTLVEVGEQVDAAPADPRRVFAARRSGANQNVLPSTDADASRGAAASMPRLASPTVSPDHQAKSCGSAGPWLAK